MRTKSEPMRHLESQRDRAHAAPETLSNPKQNYQTRPALCFQQKRNAEANSHHSPGDEMLRDATWNGLIGGPPSHNPSPIACKPSGRVEPKTKITKRSQFGPLFSTKAPRGSQFPSRSMIRNAT